MCPSFTSHFRPGFVHSFLIESSCLSAVAGVGSECVCVCLLQILEDYGTQESTEQNSSDLETKMEVARQSLRRAEVSAFVHTQSLVELDFCFPNQSHVTGLGQGSTCW